MVQLNYGYDQASNRLWRQDAVAEGASVNLDEHYYYDGLYRLQDMQRGSLTENDDTITDIDFRDLGPRSNRQLGELCRVADGTDVSSIKRAPQARSTRFNGSCPVPSAPSWLRARL